MVINGHFLNQLQPGIWRIEPSGKMKAGVNLVGCASLLQKLSGDKSIDQAVNVASLPGVVDPVVTMPDIHQGYGFPIGGVAAFRPQNGVVSPGGVGYDINCGVRVLKTSLERNALPPKLIKPLLHSLFDSIPTGVGARRNDIFFSDQEFQTILEKGASDAIARGFGLSSDIDWLEERGKIIGADPSQVSARALERGLNQLGTLGSGNHFVEIQYIDEIGDEKAAEAFGLFQNQILITIHTGSRGLGYQVCSDYLEECQKHRKRFGLEGVERELAAAPIESETGQNYLKAMAAAANFAFANRQIISHWVRESFHQHLGVRDLPVLYDVCHNIAKFEEFRLGKHSQKLCIHRKGATRAYPAKTPGLPAAYRDVGQPVVVPGDMGRYSFILVGTDKTMQETFGSSCHGAGRELSRNQAKKAARGRTIEKELLEQGIHIRAAGRGTIVEEMPEAYKDVADVVKGTIEAGLARKVARLRPLAVIKG